MDWLTERNKEQVLGMQDLLRLFVEKRIALHVLVTSLTGKRNGMINVNTSWDSDFQKYWMNLEICSALAFEAAENNQNVDITARAYSAADGMQRFLSDTLRALSE